MTENRDFLKEFEELRAETDGIRDALVSKTGHFHNLLFDSGVLKEIMGELKAIRKENKENQEKNDKKIEELRTEIKAEMATVKSELLLDIRQKLEENRKELLDEIKKMQEKAAPEIPIRQVILGEWKCVEYENFKGWKKINPDYSFELFSENVKYTMEGGLLKQTDGSYVRMAETENAKKHRRIYVEDNHLKTVTDSETIYRYIRDGRLYVVHHKNGEVWKRIYHKI